MVRLESVGTYQQMIGCSTFYTTGRHTLISLSTRTSFEAQLFRSLENYPAPRPPDRPACFFFPLKIRRLNIPSIYPSLRPLHYHLANQLCQLTFLLHHHYLRLICLFSLAPVINVLAHQGYHNYRDKNYYLPDFWSVRWNRNSIFHVKKLNPNIIHMKFGKYITV